MPPINFLNTEYFFQRVYDIIAGQGVLAMLKIALAYFLSYLDTIRLGAVLISLVLLTFIIYSHMRTHQINHEEEAKLGIRAHGVHRPSRVAVTEAEKEAEVSEPEKVANPKWPRVVAHVHSDRESDWRLAILEADIMLDEMLEGMGYRGETLADKLKAIEPSDFLTLDKAWEAHKIRNTIAHEGSDFMLTQREAKRVIGLFADVFKESRFI